MAMFPSLPTVVIYQFRTKYILTTSVLVSLATSTGLSAQTVWYVNANAAGANNGSSWPDAFRDLQLALVCTPPTVCAGPGDQIWVAEGTYAPAAPGGSVRATFKLRNGIALYGGFAGIEAAIEQRDATTRITILTGDIDRDDTFNRANNSYHVVTASGTTSTAILDGFTITAGNANRAVPDSEGAGVFNMGGSPTIRNCKVVGNQAFSGAGMFNQLGNPIVSQCTFTDNFAFAAGGGMHNISSNPVITSTTFAENTTGGFGGGIYNIGASTPTLADCSFTDNSATTRGGAVYNDSDSGPTLTRCEFVENSADDGGAVYSLSRHLMLTDCAFTGNTANATGGAMSNISSDPIISNCRFAANSAVDGGGLYNLNGSPILTKCIFSENAAASTGGGLNTSTGEPKLSSCEFSGNAADEGGGMYNLSGRPILTDCVFVANSANLRGGGMSNNDSDPQIIRTSFSDNTVFSISGDGGGIWNLSSNPMLIGCTFRRNSAVRGGAISNLSSVPTITNGLFSGNSASYGGGMFNDGSSPTLTNATFSGNEASLGGGVANFNSSHPTLTNCILWGNHDSIPQESITWQIYSDGIGVLVNYTCIQGLHGTFGGVGNIGENPLFVDPDGEDNIVGTADDDLRLLPGSPCADAGNNLAVPADVADLDGDGDRTEALPFDLGGTPRFLDDPLAPDGGHGTRPIVDMGAYEHKTPIRFVQQSATGTKDGTSWADAYTDVQRALGDARAAKGAVQEIWVAAGRYAPTGPGGDRTIAFDLVDGVGIYGGFFGSETALKQRNPKLNLTILTGDLNGDDENDFQNVSENSLHVVTAENTGATAVLDGFVIVGGNADESCGQCFTSGGGGVSMMNSSSKLADCRVKTNRARAGGGMAINGGSPTLTNCVFESNMATGSGSNDAAGGGVVVNGSSPTLVNCRLIGNSTPLGGGAMYISGASAPKLVNCLLSGNTAGKNGGAIMALGGRPTLANCTLNHNQAVSSGGGMINLLNGSPIFSNCIFWDNEDSSGRTESAQVHTTTLTITLNHSCVQGLTGVFGGQGNIGLDPRFVNADGADNVVGTEDDDLRIRPGSPCIDSGDNQNVAVDVVDLDHDGNSLEPVPFDIDGNDRFVDDPATADIGKGTPPLVDMGAYEYQPDCNGNGILDAVEIANCPGGPQYCDCNGNGQPDECEISKDSEAPGGPFYCQFDCNLDCNNNGAPDDCEIPQSGSITSTWIGVSGLWDSPPSNVNWCLPQAPNNYVTTQFNVVIEGQDAVVTLNTSPTVSTASLGDGAKIVVGDQSGASVRALVVEGTLHNAGIVRATDGKRLVLDSPDIEQGVSCAGGALEASDGNTNSNAKSVLEINGGRVVGGAARTVGAHSEIHLLGGAELVNVCVSGAIIPDGHTGRFSETIRNDQIFTVAAQDLTTSLEPGTDQAVLDGVGSVVLARQDTARLGDFQKSFTNSASHHIEGAGIVFGGMINNGTINANHAGEELIVSPPGIKSNDGLLTATDGGALRIVGSVSGAGAYQAARGTIIVSGEQDAVLVSASSMEVLGSISSPGMLSITGVNATASVAGTATVRGSGSFAVDDGAALQVGGDLVLNDAQTTQCHCLAPASACNVAGGQTPPILKIRGAATASIAANLLLPQRATVQVGSAAAMTLAGNFDNAMTQPDCFDWIDGGLTLNGTSLQHITAAGVDGGPPASAAVNNFAIGTITLAPNANVVIVPQGTSGSGNHALYVAHLVLHPGSQMLASGVNVYYCTLSNEGSLPQLGTRIQAMLPMLYDANCDLRIDLNDFARELACMNASATPDCLQAFDSDVDGDVDLHDFAAFQNSFLPVH
ncbi:MAG: hypothetical protein HY287_07475 [Planctomycetes bacterium]|nr:hypothetical protein [Planctomycetota bacterium]